MTNVILSILALAGFALFLGIVAWFVREPDLIIVLVLGLVLAAFDFWRSFQATRPNGG